MHFNKLQQQQQQQDQIQNKFNSTWTTLPSSDGEANKITSSAKTSTTDRYTGSGDSCTSSTDSGVHTSDNEAVAGAATPSPTNPLRVKFLKNTDDNTSSSNVDKIEDNDSHGRGEEDKCRATFTRIFDNKFKNEAQHSGNNNNSSNSESNYTQNQNSIQNENVINPSQAATQRHEELPQVSTHPTEVPRNGFDEPRRAVSPTPSSIVYSSDSSDDEGLCRLKGLNRSSNVSIRSIDSSIIDSDSDSDLTGAAEGVHENYVIKKLGTQVSYPAKHPDIPNLNNGLQVINHQITPHGMGPEAPSPLAVLSQMSENIGRLTTARQNGEMPSNVPQIAVSASKDITIGDKHFYEGPVTIQQFLIDSRDKWKDPNGDGKDNPNFEGGGAEMCSNAKDINSTPTSELPQSSYAKLLRNKKYLIPGALIMAVLVVVIVVLGIEAASDDSKSKKALANSEESRKNIPINSTIDTLTNPSKPGVIDDVKCVEGKLCLVERDLWQALPQTATLDPQTLPLHRVVIGHTATEPCEDAFTCVERVRNIQTFHMNSFGWDDIGYNFLISSHGRVYVGRGWDDVGAHTKGYNYDSVGIAFIGTYTTTKPTTAQLEACQLLIEEGVRLKKLVPTYNLYGARQLGATESPGEALYKIIRTWDHWSPKV